MRLSCFCELSAMTLHFCVGLACGEFSKPSSPTLNDNIERKIMISCERRNYYSGKYNFFANFYRVRTALSPQTLQTFQRLFQDLPLKTALSLFVHTHLWLCVKDYVHLKFPLLLKQLNIFNKCYFILHFLYKMFCTQPVPLTHTIITPVKNISRQKENSITSSVGYSSLQTVRVQR